MPSTIDNSAPVPGPSPGPGVPVIPGGDDPLPKPDPLGGELAVTNAQSAFDVFYEEKKARFGVSRPAREYDRNPNWPHFLQLALICAARGWDPADYVKKAVGGQRTSAALLPSDLLRPSILKAYRKPESVKDAETEYRECVGLLIARECDGNGGNDEKSLLLSPMSAFPAWFRVWYPESVDMEIVGAWGEIAKREISSSPEIKSLLERIDPAKWEKIRKLLWIYAMEGGQG